MAEFKVKIDEFKNKNITEIIMEIDDNERNQSDLIHYTELENLMSFNFPERISLLTSDILYSNNWNIKPLQEPEEFLYSAFPFLEEKQFNNTFVIGGMLLNLCLGISTNAIDLDIAVSESEHENIPIMIESIQQYYKDSYNDSISIVTSRRFPVERNSSYVKNITYIHIYSNKNQSLNNVKSVIPDLLQEIQIISVEDVYKYVNDFDIPLSKIFIKLGSRSKTLINYSAGLCLLTNAFPIISKAFSKSTIRRIMKYFINKNMAILLPSSGHLPTMLYKLSKVRTEIGYKVNNISIRSDKIKNIEAIVSINNGYEIARKCIGANDNISSLEIGRLLKVFRKDNFVTISSESGNSLNYIISIKVGSELIKKFPNYSNYEISIGSDLKQFDIKLYERYRSIKLLSKSNTLIGLSSLTPTMNLDELKNLFDISITQKKSLFDIYNSVVNNREDIKDAELIIGYINKYRAKTQDLWNIYFGNTSDVKNKSSSFNRIDVSEFIWEEDPNIVSPPIINRQESVLDFMLKKNNELKQNNECCICLSMCNPSNGDYASICGRHIYHLECYVSYRNSTIKKGGKIVCPYCKC